MIRIAWLLMLVVVGGTDVQQSTTEEINSNNNDNNSYCNKDNYSECNVKKNSTAYEKKELKYTDEDVDFGNYLTPEIDMERIIEIITKPGESGWMVLSGMHSARDVEMARERVIHYTNADYYMSMLDKHEENDEVHNNYRGLVWSLLTKGRIFEKMAAHPTILNISNAILGQGAQLSSYAANTVLPGMKGQQPHLDYPYYRNFLPEKNPHIMDSAPPMALQFITLLTDFTLENGGTAIRPGSHTNPRYPDDSKEFFDNAIQMTGKAGDVVLIAGAIQHCAMPNHSKNFRSGILQHMAPVYLKTFENMQAYISEDLEARASNNLRQLLAIDHPYPITKA